MADIEVLEGDHGPRQLGFKIFESIGVPLMKQESKGAFVPFSKEDELQEGDIVFAAGIFGKGYWRFRVQRCGDFLLGVSAGLHASIEYDESEGWKAMCFYNPEALKRISFDR